MMYDDVAHGHALQNKLRGHLYNRPDGASSAAPDVYAAVKDHIDYRKGQVSPANFLKVLTGDASAPGRVLKSGPNDDVFVYFADHGGMGILAFPNLVDVIPRTLSADHLHAALAKMKAKHMFRRLTFYTEACESGSMFDGLLDPSLGIYVVTAANPKESSWGWYCDHSTEGGNVQGKWLGVCLGDEFSVKWMENTDAADEAKVSLAEQYTAVRYHLVVSGMYLSRCDARGVPHLAWGEAAGGDARVSRHSPPCLGYCIYGAGVCGIAVNTAV